MQEEEFFKNLTGLCNDYIKRIREVKNELVNDFLSQETQDVPIITLNSEIPQGKRIRLVKSITDILKYADQQQCDFRIVVNQQTKLSDPIWCVPTFPLLITTEGCETVLDVLNEAKQLRKKFKQDFLTRMPEFPTIKKLFQYWDSKVALRYQKNLDKKIERLGTVLLDYIKDPQNLEACNKTKALIDSLEVLFHINDSFGNRVPLTAKNDAVVDKIRSISPEIGNEINTCFKRVNQKKPLHLELQILRDYLCLSR